MRRSPALDGKGRRSALLSPSRRTAAIAGGALLALLLAVAFPVLSQKSEDPLIEGQRQLQTLKRQMEENRKKIEELRRKEKNLGAVDERIRRDRELTESYLAQLEAQERALLGDLEQRQGELDEKVARQEEVGSSLRRRLRAFQRHRQPGTPELLLSSKGFADLFSRATLLSQAIQKDRADLIWLAQQKDELALATSLLLSRQRGLDQLQEEKLREKQRLDKKAAAAQREMVGVRKERGKFEERQKELAKSEAQIKGLIARLEKERAEAKKRGTPSQAGPGLGGKRHGLRWPVEGKLVGRFGLERNPRFGTEVPSNGIDIAAPAGTPVAAVAAGRVEFVDWLSGYGRCVILDHGGGFYTLYAHCSRVLVGKGAKVAEGETIAEVGDTDSIKGTCLHFEIRRGEEAMDPQEWLR
ncbi:MAG: murein hydrolase activator EnvC [Candidatus Eisenbacteria bacterium]